MIKEILLGIVQGITEWLPISSSGHLVLMQYFLGIKPPIVLDVMLHFASLIVIIIFFRKEILELIKGILLREKKYLKLFFFYIIATLPIAFIGFFFKDLIENIFKDLKLVGFSFLFTSLLLFLSQFPKKKTKEITWKNAIIIGIAQAIALLPGVSRSGSTISTGMILGIKKEEVAKFSFILVIPAILGATIIEVKNIGKIDNLLNLFMGMLATIISGLLSLKFLMSVIKKDKFSYFSIYCFILGVITLIIAFA